MNTLPKPTRVERWQRWRNDMGEVLVMAIEPSHITGLDDFARLANGYGTRLTSELLNWPEWTFLGYAKPDKVEVGQRWRDERGSIFTATRQRGTSSIWRCVKDGGANDEWLMGYMLEPWSKWEYLGMAESVPEIKRAFATTPNKSRDEMTLAGTSREDSTVRDPKAEARRANEEAAKRLIANPPDWAYPKAWMCAILAALEAYGGNKWESDPGSAITIPALRRYHERRLAGECHDTAKRGMEHSETIVNAYARGMERPTPLLTRQGGKGGISTCDLGVDYE